MDHRLILSIWLIDSKLYLEVPQFIPVTHLIKARAALKGVDNRTIKKYVKRSEAFGCIKIWYSYV
jgi:hypothetical protein